MKHSPFASGKETILVVNNNPEGLARTQQLLESAGFPVAAYCSTSEAIDQIENGEQPDLILLEIDGADEAMTMIQTCRRLRAEQKIAVFSEIHDVSTVVQAVRMGALDYIAKPVDDSGLIAAVQRLLEPVASAANEPSHKNSPREHFETVENEIFFLAASAAMQKIRTQVEQVAKVDIPVLLLGESGAGKEVLARLVHKLSRRAGKPLVKVNCAALPHDLLESELFGYEAGAFTGANRSKPGMLELCDKGTIFLDEIGEMSPALQAKLLHVLQDGKFTRLGGRTTVTSNFRVLAATNINVHEAINSKTFREDLYYRLNAFTVNIPPLRERREEIPLLLKHFMQQFSDKYDCSPAECSHALVRACMRHTWPGNLRELGNFVKRYMVLQDETLAIAELEEKDPSAEIAPNLEDEALMHGGAGLKSMVQNLKERAEPRIIERVLIATKWNCKVAATQLQISYKALLYKMKQYRIFPPGVSGPGLRNAHG
ncbi:MAG TPA: sigma-54 dependent transcriptional regulator [Candidatus Angelobacter sp.]|nr:sigma-54 dependent transcriptional regulator [Candidatus Angelobacter sp.]